MLPVCGRVGANEAAVDVNAGLDVTVSAAGAAAAG